MTVDQLEHHLKELRPRLHRYCSRMTGSVIDGEDVVQDAMLKATAAVTHENVANVEAWVFRIAHNAALDYLRKRARRGEDSLEDGVDDIQALDRPTDDVDIVYASLWKFMQLMPQQRSAVILMDVLGYSLSDIADVLSSTIPSVKAALHRGRKRLRELAQEQGDAGYHWAPGERALYQAYVDRFNARDFDAVRDMLAEEVRLELVGRMRKSGKGAVSTYFNNYASVGDWRLQVGSVDGRPAIVVQDQAQDLGHPAYFVLIEWREEQVLEIRDFRHARYAVDDATVTVG